MAAERLAGAAQVVVVGDREADIYSHIAACPPEVDLLVRARHDRALAEGGTLFAQTAAWPVHTQALVAAAPRGDKGRVAQVAICSNRVKVARPASAEPSDPASLELGLVEVRELDPPAGVKPLLWRLVTTLPVDGPAAAQEAVRLSPALAHRGGVPHAQERRPAPGGDAGARPGAGLPPRGPGPGRGGAHPPAGRRPRRRPPPHERRARQPLHRSGRRPQPIPRRRNRQAEESASKGVSRLARLGRGPPRRMELLWQAPGPKTMAKGWERFSATLSGFILAKPDPLV